LVKDRKATINSGKRDANVGKDIMSLLGAVHKPHSSTPC
jgi:hypothetical protein